MKRFSKSFAAGLLAVVLSLASAAAALASDKTNPADSGNSVYWTMPFGEPGLYKTDPATYDTLLLAKDVVFGKPIVIGDWVYYAKETMNSGRYGDVVQAQLYRINKDGTGKKKLSDDTITSFDIDGNFIYYTDYNEESIVRINLDGSSRHTLAKQRSFTINIVGSWLYYANDEHGGDNAIYRMKQDGTGAEKFSKGQYSYFDNVFVTEYGDKLFYSEYDANWDNYTRVLVNRDGSGELRAVDTDSILVLSIDPNTGTITYWDYSDSVQKLYQSDFNRTNAKQVEAKPIDGDLLAPYQNGLLCRSADGLMFTVGKDGTVSEPAAPKLSLAPGIEIDVIFNGVQQTFDQPPVSRNDSVLVPMRAIFEALGADVGWDDDTQTATAKRGDLTIMLEIGAETAQVNGEPVRLTQPAIKLNDRTLVPVRFVSEQLNALVEWSEDTQTVSITYPKH